MKTHQEFWDKAAARYAKSRIRDEASYQRKLAKTQEYFRPDWNVLEFGCGTGSTAIIHAPHVRHIHATDVSGKMLEIGQEKAQAAGVENIRFERGTLDTLTLVPESYDAVLGLNILHLVENLEDTIARVHGLLKPGGIFVSSTVLSADIPWYWRLLIPVAQFLGMAPYVGKVSKAQLLDILARTGFSIDHEWMPGKISIFLVAKKSG